MKIWLCLVVAGALVPVVRGEGLAHGVSQAFAVDSRTGFARRSPERMDVGYSPVWSGGEYVAGSHVVLERVDCPDGPTAVTTTVSVCSADASGVCTILPEADGMSVFRLIHRTEKDGKTLGVPLVADVAIGLSSTPGETFIGDSRADALQSLAKRQGTALLTYDTGWATDVARITLASVTGSATNEIMSADADASGSYPVSLGGTGWCRFLLMFYAADSTGICALETEPFKLSSGMFLLVR